MVYGVYRVNKDYTDTLRRAGHDVSENTQQYCGPVYEITEDNKSVSFFAPIRNGYDSSKCYIMTFRNNVLAELIDFNKMIPCFDVFLKTDSADVEIADFCKTNENFIRMCAAFVAEHYMKK